MLYRTEAMQPAFAIRNFMNETSIFLVLKRSLLLHLAERRVRRREERKNKEKKERGREGEGKS